MPEESNSMISIRDMPKQMSKKVSEKIMGSLQVYANEDSGGDLHEDPMPGSCLLSHWSYPIQLPTHLTTVLSLSLRGISASQALGFNPTHCKSQLRILGISIRHLSLFNDCFSKVETAFQILSMKLEFTVKKQFRISCKIQGWKSPFLPC